MGVVMIMVLMAVHVRMAVVGAMAVLARVVVRVGRFRAVGVLRMGVIMIMHVRTLLIVAVVVAVAVRLGDFGLSNDLHMEAASTPAVHIPCAAAGAHRLLPTVICTSASLTGSTEAKYLQPQWVSSFLTCSLRLASERQAMSGSLENTCVFSSSSPHRPLCPDQSRQCPARSPPSHPPSAPSPLALEH